MKTYSVQCNYTIGVELVVEADSREEVESIANQLEFHHFKLDEYLPFGVTHGEINYLAYADATID